MGGRGKGRFDDICKYYGVDGGGWGERVEGRGEGVECGGEGVGGIYLTLVEVRLQGW